MTNRHSVFARMWGVAVLAHLAGNWRYGDILPDSSLIGWLLATAGLLATLAIVSPRRWHMFALAVIVPVTVILEAPVLGNHWLLAGFVSVAYLLAAGDFDRFERIARVILLVFYGFAAFAKLNTGFLDPQTSCGVFYANQWLMSYGLARVSPVGISGLLASYGSALVELSIPILLVFRRTRTAGVLLAVTFHGVLSLDLSQHFFDFTGVLLPLFVLFLGDGFFDRLDGVGDSLRPLSRRILAGVAGLIGAAVTVSNVTPLSEASAWWLVRGSFWWWTPYLAVVAWAAFREAKPAAVDFKLGAVAWGLIALVVLNGLTPYLELKTAFGWNMYSNLVTVDGETNHLLIPGTLPLREGHEDLVTIVDSSDPGLAAYATENYLLPWPSFVSYIGAHPDISVSFERDGFRYDLPRAGDTNLDEQAQWWWRWFPLRAVHASEPDRCQPSFLPAL